MEIDPYGHGVAAHGAGSPHAELAPKVSLTQSPLALAWVIVVENRRRAASPTSSSGPDLHLGVDYDVPHLV
jgi:hypothetical protein